MIAWAPTLIASLPGLFMGDTGAQIRQWFNYPNGTSDYLRLLNPNVLLNGHHPVVHTAIIGSCVQLGLSLFNSANAGLAIYTCAQFVITAACMAYSISSLRKLGVSLPVRGVDPAVLCVYADVLQLRGAADQRRALCRRVFGAAGTDRQARGMWLAPSRCQCRARGRDRRLCSLRATTGCCSLLGAMGSTFLRNGGLVFPLAACVIAAAFCAMGRACGSSCSQADWCSRRQCAIAAFPLGWRSRGARALPCL